MYVCMYVCMYIYIYIYIHTLYIEGFEAKRHGSVEAALSHRHLRQGRAQDGPSSFSDQAPSALSRKRGFGVPFTCSEAASHYVVLRSSLFCLVLFVVVCLEVVGAGLSHLQPRPLGAAWGTESDARTIVLYYPGGISGTAVKHWGQAATTRIVLGVC